MKEANQIISLPCHRLLDWEIQSRNKINRSLMKSTIFCQKHFLSVCAHCTSSRGRKFGQTGRTNSHCCQSLRQWNFPLFLSQIGVHLMSLFKMQIPASESGKNYFSVSTSLFICLNTTIKYRNVKLSFCLSGIRSFCSVAQIAKPASVIQLDKKANRKHRLGDREIDSEDDNGCRFFTDANVDTKNWGRILSCNVISASITAEEWRANIPYYGRR
jgi:hypothetical protein